MAFGRKSYGESKIDLCIICGTSAYKKNDVGVPVCGTHEHAEMPAWKCMCGNWVDILYGKYGTYCNCPRCGNLNVEKIRVHNLENPPTLKSGKPVSSLTSETNVSSNKSISQKSVFKNTLDARDVKQTPVKKEISSIYPLDIPDDCNLKF